MNLPRGLSYLELTVKAKEGDSNPGISFPILVELDEIELSALDATPRWLSRNVSAAALAE